MAWQPNKKFCRPKVWRPCQRHKDRAKGMMIIPKPQWLCQSHNEYAKGMKTPPKVWRPCKRRGDHGKGMLTMQKAWRPFQRPKVWWPCQRNGDHDEGMDTKLKVWWSGHRHGNHASRQTDRRGYLQSRMYTRLLLTPCAVGSERRNKETMIRQTEDHSSFERSFLWPSDARCHWIEKSLWLEW